MEPIFNKLTALLLVLCMLVSILPPAALAANGPSTHPNASLLLGESSTNSTVATLYSYSAGVNNTVAGMSYDLDTNTLTLNSYQSDSQYILATMMGDDFKVVVNGSCELANITVRNLSGSCGLEVTGAGALILNQDCLNNYGLHLQLGGDNTNLAIGANVSLTVYAPTDSRAVFVEGSGNSASPISGSLQAGQAVSKQEQLVKQISGNNYTIYSKEGSYFGAWTLYNSGIPYYTMYSLSGDLTAPVLGAAVAGESWLSAVPAAYSPVYSDQYNWTIADRNDFSDALTTVQFGPGGSQPGPTITTSTLPGGAMGTAYSQTLAATSQGSGAITWSSNNLPAWLSLSANGVLSGTPTQAGNYTFKVTAMEAGGGTAERTFTIAVAADPAQLTLALEVSGDGSKLKINDSLETPLQLSLSLTRGDTVAEEVYGTATVKVESASPFSCGDMTAFATSHDTEVSITGGQGYLKISSFKLENRDLYSTTPVTLTLTPQFTPAGSSPLTLPESVTVTLNPEGVDGNYVVFTGRFVDQAQNKAGGASVTVNYWYDRGNTGGYSYIGTQTAVTDANGNYTFYFPQEQQYRKGKFQQNYFRQFANFTIIPAGETGFSTDLAPAANGNTIETITRYASSYTIPLDLEYEIFNESMNSSSRALTEAELKQLSLIVQAADEQSLALDFKLDTVNRRLVNDNPTYNGKVQVSSIHFAAQELALSGDVYAAYSGANLAPATLTLNKDAGYAYAIYSPEGKHLSQESFYLADKKLAGLYTCVKVPDKLKQYVKAGSLQNLKDILQDKQYALTTVFMGGGTNKTVAVSGAPIATKSVTRWTATAAPSADKTKAGLRYNVSGSLDLMGTSAVFLDYIDVTLPEGFTLVENSVSYGGNTTSVVSGYKTEKLSANAYRITLKQQYYVPGYSNIAGVLGLTVEKPDLISSGNIGIAVCYSLDGQEEQQQNIAFIPSSAFTLNGSVSTNGSSVVFSGKAPAGAQVTLVERNGRAASVTVAANRAGSYEYKGSLAIAPEVKYGDTLLFSATSGGSASNTIAVKYTASGNDLVTELYFMSGGGKTYIISPQEQFKRSVITFPASRILDFTVQIDPTRIPADSAVAEMMLIFTCSDNYEYYAYLTEQPDGISWTGTVDTSALGGMSVAITDISVGYGFEYQVKGEDPTPDLTVKTDASGAIYLEGLFSEDSDTGLTQEDLAALSAEMVKSVKTGVKDITVADQGGSNWKLETAVNEIELDDALMGDTSIKTTSTFMNAEIPNVNLVNSGFTKVEELGNGGTLYSKMDMQLVYSDANGTQQTVKIDFDALMNEINNLSTTLQNGGTISPTSSIYQLYEASQHNNVEYRIGTLSMVQGGDGHFTAPVPLNNTQTGSAAAPFAVAQVDAGELPDISYVSPMLLASAADSGIVLLADNSTPPSEEGNWFNWVSNEVKTQIDNVVNFRNNSTEGTIVYETVTATAWATADAALDMVSKLAGSSGSSLATGLSSFLSMISSVAEIGFKFVDCLNITRNVSIEIDDLKRVKYRAIYEKDWFGNPKAVYQEDQICLRYQKMDQNDQAELDRLIQQLKELSVATNALFMLAGVLNAAMLGYGVGCVLIAASTAGAAMVPSLLTSLVVAVVAMAGNAGLNAGLGQVEASVNEARTRKCNLLAKMRTNLNNDSTEQGDCTRRPQENKTVQHSDVNQVFKYDPSGAVYDATTQAPIAGAKAILYFSPSPEGTNPIPWVNAGEEGFAGAGAYPFGTPNEWDELGLQYTNGEGKYAWNVPDGYYYQVRISADGYIAQESEWMRVLPARYGVDFYLNPMGGGNSPDNNGGGGRDSMTTGFSSGGSISLSELEQLAKAGRSLTVRGKDGAKIVFDASALQGIIAQVRDGDSDSAANSTFGSIVVEITDVSAAYQQDYPGRAVFSLTVTAAGKNIAGFGGNVTISLPYELQEGENPQDVTVWHVAEEGTLMEIPCTYDPATKLVAFTVDHFSYYMVGAVVAPTTPVTGAVKNPFNDVKSSDWFYDAVMYVYEQGLMKGTDANTFSPYLTTTRGMIVTILWLMENEPGADLSPSFNDVTAGKYYYKAVAWASGQGIVNGYSARAFGPEDNITREQLATILYNYAAWKGMEPPATGDLSRFSDANQISAWAKTPMSWANSAGLINGIGDNRLDPTGQAQRCQAASILQGFMEN